MRALRELAACLLLALAGFLPVGGILAVAFAADVGDQIRWGGVGAVGFWLAYSSILGAGFGLLAGLWRTVRGSPKPMDPRVWLGAFLALALALAFLAPPLVELVYWRAPPWQTFERGEWPWLALGILAIPLPLLAARLWKARRQRVPPWRTVLLPGFLLATALALAAIGIAPVGTLPSPPVVEAPRRQGRAMTSQVLVVVIDGLTDKVLGPLISQGRVPNLAAIAARGARGHILAPSHYISFAILASFATGHSDVEAGVRDYLKVRFPFLGPVWADRRTTRRYYLAAPLVPLKVVTLVWPERRDWNFPPVWELLMAAGARCHVVAWHGYAGPPPIPPRGTLAGYLAFPNPWEVLYTVPIDRPAQWWSDRDVSALQRHILLPWKLTRDDLSPVLALTPEIEEEVRQCEETSDIDSVGFHVARAYALDLSATRVLDELLATDPPAFAGIHYSGFDLYAHMFWHYRFPEEGRAHPRLDAGEPPNPSFAEAVDRYLEFLDRQIGTLRARLREDATVIVVSDHGMAQPVAAAQRIWAWEHYGDGVLLAAGPKIAPGATAAAHPQDLAPTVLALLGYKIPRDMTGRPLTEILAPE